MNILKNLGEFKITIKDGSYVSKATCDDEDKINICFINCIISQNHNLEIDKLLGRLYGDIIITTSGKKDNKAIYLFYREVINKKDSIKFIKRYSRSEYDRDIILDDIKKYENGKAILFNNNEYTQLECMEFAERYLKIK